MQKNFALVHTWAAWPAIFNDDDFMKKATPLIEDVVDEFGDYIQEKAEIFALDDPAIICKIEVLLNHLGGNSKTDPHHEDTDSSVGTFLMFAVRDGLEFCGLLPGSKRVYHAEYSLC